jgi:DNA-binding transcriptional LysR family regulator
VTLTEAGRLLQDEARGLLRQAEALRDRLRQVAQGEQGRLALGFTSSAAAHAYMPRTLRACRQQHPHIGLDLREANAAEITDAVQAGHLHCGFLRVPTNRPPELQFETLFHEPALLALPIDHPLAPRPGEPVRPLALTALRDEGFILVRQPGAPGLYANLLALCEAQGFSPRVVAEVPRMMSNLNLVAPAWGVGGAGVIGARIPGISGRDAAPTRGAAAGDRTKARCAILSTWRRAGAAPAGPGGRPVAMKTRHRLVAGALAAPGVPAPAAGNHQRGCAAVAYPVGGSAQVARAWPVLAQLGGRDRGHRPSASGTLAIEPWRVRRPMAARSPFGLTPLTWPLPP